MARPVTIRTLDLHVVRGGVGIVPVLGEIPEVSPHLAVLVTRRVQADVLGSLRPLPLALLFHVSNFLVEDSVCRQVAQVISLPHSSMAIFFRNSNLFA